MIRTPERVNRILHRHPLHSISSDIIVCGRNVPKERTCLAYDDRLALGVKVLIPDTHNSIDSSRSEPTRMSRAQAEHSRCAWDMDTYRNVRVGLSVLHSSNIDDVIRFGAQPVGDRTEIAYRCAQDVDHACPNNEAFERCVLTVNVSRGICGERGSMDIFVGICRSS